MEELNLTHSIGHSPTLRDVLAIVFRRRRLMALSFFGILVGAVLATVLQTNRYEAAMKILVKRDRVDPIVTPDAASGPQVNQAVTEEELNSEVELLKSKELLEKIVRTCNLQDQKKSSWPRALAAIGVGTPSGTATPEARIAETVRDLEEQLKIDVVKKTNLIAVSYESPDPQLAVRVLRTLANVYLEKHVAVHRPPGAFDFFQHETRRYREGLTEAQARLVDFTRGSDVVSAPLEKTVALQKLAEFESTLRQTEASIAETKQRIGILREQAASTPTRIVTQVRQADDGVLLSQLRANLLALEQKRTELLGKFEPSYRPVQEVDAQIAQTRAALASAEKSRLNDETTDRDPTYELVREELAKANAELAGLQARAKATAMTVRSYQEAARSLGQKEIIQDDLLREVKASEDNYLLYLRKEEESRISDALDRGRILNVVIAEVATLPSLPSNHRSRVMLFGMLLAMVSSVGLAFVSEHLDATFRTPDEVGAFLDTPVLASIPRNGKNGSAISVS